MNSWFMVELMCKGLDRCPFSKTYQDVSKSQYGYVFLLNGKHRELERVSKQRARLLILQQRVGRVETQTVKLVSEVCLVVILWRQKRHQMGLGPH